MQTCLDLHEHNGGVYSRSWALFSMRSGYYKMIIKDGGTEVVFSAQVQNWCVHQRCSMTGVAVTDIALRINEKSQKVRRAWRLHLFLKVHWLCLRVNILTKIVSDKDWNNYILENLVMLSLHFVEREFKSLVMSIEFNSESDTVLTAGSCKLSRGFNIKLCRSKWWVILLDCKLPL